MVKRPLAAGIQRQVTLHRQPPAITKAQGHRLDAGVLRRVLRCCASRSIGTMSASAGVVPGGRWCSTPLRIAIRSSVNCQGSDGSPQGLFRTAGRVCDQPCQIKFAIGRNAEMHPWADQSYLREPYLAVNSGPASRSMVTSATLARCRPAAPAASIPVASFAR